MVFQLPPLQLAAAVLLIPVVPAMLALAVASGRRVRLMHGGGTDDPVAFTGMVAACVGLAFLFLDTHTTLGPRMFQWSAIGAAAGGALWLALDWKRLRAVRPALVGILQGAMFFVLSGFWAVGSLYQVNLHADLSARACDPTRALATRQSSGRKSVVRYYVTVATWSGRPEGAGELEVSRDTFEALQPGAAVEVCMRSGALGIPWVDEVRLKQ
jgi:hypothetical protein